ncbi:hypothetical protein HFO26_18135 [Rhizobium leguminosarum]|uniref:hypothetical protein n=1 Tax=Rhizobium leguminosarum TaxID=384 RepID=UPI001C96C2C6|nr:hypothetical protein [Rhizobium leguminosarum]MBY5732184.1 hypothetical protein [Rhizobium leguminosarum]
MSEAPDGTLDHLWTEVLVFPHISLLSDEQMGAYFQDFDGQWSAQTKRAMRDHGAVGLELNSNWALERQHWTCPGCARSKPEVFRKSSSDILLAKLELHHDHLWEVATRRPAMVAGADWRDILADGAPFVVENIRSLVVRFEDSLICSECNAADGKAKRALQVDPRFSYSAAEIGRFVKPAPNRDHDIDLDCAREIWDEQRPSFERRILLLEMLVDDLVAGHLQRCREGAIPAGRPLMSRVGIEETLRSAFWSASRGTQNYGQLSGLRADFLARSVRKDIPQRAKRKTDTRIPTDEEYQAYMPETAPQAWAGAAEDWTCPCCARTKRSSMRMSAKKKWSGAIRNVAQYPILQDDDEIVLRERLFPDFPNEMHLKEMVWVEVCSDCADVIPRIKQIHRDLPDAHLTLDQMKAVLAGIENHMPHEINFDLAWELAKANFRYRYAGEALSAFSNLKSTFKRQMEFAAKYPEARQDVFERLTFELEVERRIGDPQERKEIMTMLKDDDYRLSRKSHPEGAEYEF